MTDFIKINLLKRMKLSALLPPVIIGNLFEWYDFSLYGYLAPFIATLFFPKTDPDTALISAFSVFMTGYLARPVGSIVFGWMGDKLGRKSALSMSVLLMAISTCALGMLPTYQTAGFYAPLILIACRLIQGFAIGGEFTISIAYVIEHAPGHKKGMFGSLTMLGTFLGLLLGSLTAALLSKLFSDSAILNGAWRIPFLLSLPLGLIGLIMRTRLPETPAFRQSVNDGLLTENPVTEVLRNHCRTILIAIGIVCLGACSFSLWFIWLPSYLKLRSTLNSSQILTMNSFNLLVIAAVIPVAGYGLDRIGTKKTILFAGFATIVFALPLTMNMAHLTVGTLWSGQLCFALLAALAYSAVPLTLFNLFPAPVRCTGISIAYNIANMLFGGGVPLLAALIFTSTDEFSLQCVPVVLAATITLFSVCSRR